MAYKCQRRAESREKEIKPKPKSKTDGTITRRAPKRSTSRPTNGKAILITRRDKENARDTWARFQPNS